jgi:hypothetical protein
MHFSVWKHLTYERGDIPRSTAEVEDSLHRGQIIADDFHRLLQEINRRPKPGGMKLEIEVRIPNHALSRERETVRQ